MPMMTVRNIPAEVHRAIKVRAALHGRSAEAEVRAILKASLKADNRVKLGSILAEIGKEVGLTDDDFKILSEVRDKSPGKPVDF
ncbi:MAG: Arc family DNA-binding protein [Cellvibrionaceae bacterium]|nr:Arc family DNA-binding protein [Cellvibrionaceae bacterium]